MGNQTVLCTQSRRLLKYAVPSLRRRTQGIFYVVLVRISCLNKPIKKRALTRVSHFHELPYHKCCRTSTRISPRLTRRKASTIASSSKKHSSLFLSFFHGSFKTFPVHVLLATFVFISARKRLEEMFFRPQFLCPLRSMEVGNPKSKIPLCSRYLSVRLEFNHGYSS